MKKIFPVLLGVLLLAACRKAELPDDVLETPVFSVSFEQGDSSQQHVLVAGVDGRYLFTSFERDNFDVVTMKGAFAAADCPAADCPGTLTFEFRNTQPGAVIQIDSSVLVLGDYTYKQPAGDSTFVPQLVFSFNNDTAISESMWVIRQAGNLVAESSSPVLTQVFNNQEPVEVELNYLLNSGLSGQTRSMYRFGQPPCPDVSIKVQPDTTGGSGFLLLTDVTPPANYAFQWSNGSTNSAIFVDSVQFFTPYAVTVTDGTGCTVSASVVNLVPNGPLQQTPHIAIARQDSLVLGDELQLGRVAIQWIQPETGRVFRSDRSPQPADSFFQITAAGGYEPNENGEKTDRLEVVFQALVFNADGQPQLVRGSGVIAVAYP